MIRKRPVALFVLGLGRSGTSALTRVLSLCGATLPTGLLGATDANPRGFWEPRAVIQLNQRILRHYGSSGYDPAMRFDEGGQYGAGERAAWVEKIRVYLSTLPPAPLVVVKEPKITALCGMWFEAARQAGFDIATVIAVRHPEEVIESIDRRARGQRYVQSSPELASAWWLKFTLLAERDTRGERRVFVDYANLLEDWRREVKRISLALAIELNPRNAEAVDDFLTPELRHHRQEGPAVEHFGTDWMSTVHKGLQAAARDEPWDESEMDRVFEAYRLGERAFGGVFEEYQRYRRLDRVIWPSLAKLALEALALVHRRRGTWA